MATISLTSYTPIVSQRYGELEIEIKNSDFNQVQWQEGKTTFVFDFCFFKKITIVNSEEIDFKDVSLGFIDCYIEDIQIREITSKNISIHFLSSIVSGKIQSINLNNVSVNNSISGHLFLMDMETVNISYTEENIFPRRWMRLLKELKINDYHSILSSKTSYYIHNYRKLDFRGNESKEDESGLYLTISKGNKDNRIGYKLTKEEKQLLNINLSLNFDSSNTDIQTIVNDMKLNSLSITGTSSGKISIENCGINNLYLRDFLPKGDTVFYSIGPANINNSNAASGITKHKVEIHKCNLENTWFDNFYFDEYDIVSFFRTKFSKTIFSSCNFPDNYKKFENFQSLQNSHYPENKKDNYHKDQYEIFLQLRNSLESTGNFHESQKLHAVSNDALREIDSIPFWDKVILWANKYSNNHGLSIKSAFLGFFIATIIMYILYLLSLGRIFNCNAFDSSLVSYYFAFIDITHRNDFLVGRKNFGGFTIPVDYLNKLLMSFFIFQFIAAFRKYGK
jgi:hypothetical protein